MVVFRSHCCPRQGCVVRGGGKDHSEVILSSSSGVEVGVIVEGRWGREEGAWCCCCLGARAELATAWSKREEREKALSLGHFV